MISPMLNPVPPPSPVSGFAELRTVLHVIENAAALAEKTKVLAEYIERAEVAFAAATAAINEAKEAKAEIAARERVLAERESTLEAARIAVAAREMKVAEREAKWNATVASVNAIVQGAARHKP